MSLENCRYKTSGLQSNSKIFKQLENPENYYSNAVLCQRLIVSGRFPENLGFCPISKFLGYNRLYNKFQKL